MNQRYIFRIICPICYDKEKVIYWRHEDDNSTEWIDIYGNIQCMQCGMKDFISNWRFNCADHTNKKINYHDPKNRFIEKKKFINAFAMLLTDDATDEDEKEFLKELIKYINKEWKDLFK